MPARSSDKVPITISVNKPTGTPPLANIIGDLGGNQIILQITATGNDVTLATNILWYHDPDGDKWVSFVRGWEPGLVIEDGDTAGDLLRFPVGGDAVHLQSVGSTFLANASGRVQTVREGA